MSIKPGGLLLVGVENIADSVEPFTFGGAVAVDIAEPFNFGDVHNIVVDIVEPFDFGLNLVVSVVEPFNFGANVSVSVVEPFDFGSSGGDRGGGTIDPGSGRPMAPLMGYRDR